MVLSGDRDRTALFAPGQPGRSPAVRPRWNFCTKNLQFSRRFNYLRHRRVHEIRLSPTRCLFLEAFLISALELHSEDVYVFLWNLLVEMHRAQRESTTVDHL